MDWDGWVGRGLGGSRSVSTCAGWRSGIGSEGLGRAGSARHALSHVVVCVWCAGRGRLGRREAGRALAVRITKEVPTTEKTNETVLAACPNKPMKAAKSAVDE